MFTKDHLRVLMLKAEARTYRYLSNPCQHAGSVTDYHSLVRKIKNRHKRKKMASSLIKTYLATFVGKINITFSRCHQMLQILSRNNPPPSMAVLGIPLNSSNNGNFEKQSAKSLLDSIFDGILLAVPKHRRSIEKRLHRKHRFTNFVEHGTAKNNIIPCLECGNFKEKGHLCKHCYDKVRLETKEMQSKMGEDLQFNVPRQEVEFVYEGERVENNNKYVVNMDKSRPSWFPKHLLNKTGS
ncbi:54S ribosomal protein L32, mitochondrial [Bulinus truncatus]|nr:54S ribosomal protein L32, mitochondrial [Bulinus truncatus]